MFAKVSFSYLDGVPRAHASGTTYGQIFSETVQNVLVLHLWPYDLPYTAIDKNSKPLASLWRPVLTTVVQIEFGISGVERLKRGRRTQWVAQRWHCEPSTHAEILHELRMIEVRRPKEVASYVPPPFDPPRSSTPP